MTTRLAIDALRWARISRQSYYGPWLPEPLIESTADVAESADSLTMAFLVLLEQLNPVERAVFVLHDVFDYVYDEIAAIVQKSEPDCRRPATRARRHLDRRKPRFEASRHERDRLAERFFAACQGPIYGRENLVKLLRAWFRLGADLGIRAQSVHVSGQPGATFLDPEGGLINVITLDISHGQIQTVRSVVNPDKLGHLGPPSSTAWPRSSSARTRT